MELYAVVSSDSLYENRVGSLVWKDRTRVNLDLGDDKVLFETVEVERII